jgi:carotenoid cleavage dioxygenase
VFHVLNAYDDGDTVVMDAVRWSSMFAGEHNGPFESGGHALWRWTLDLATGRVTERQLDDHDEEFPRIDERRSGRRHRFGYASVQVTASGGAHGGIVKHDLDRGSAEVLDLGLGSGDNEAVFVPRADATEAEDDGWLLALSYDPERDSSDLVVVAADDLGAGPVARVHLPQRVPFGFHGNWVPSPR